ncbi:L-glyceraldehyde 3-phosphate reductase [uncultured Propionivibrio sp.]|uniref:L-glyceraldehyde 3-phosphate reductase n=1 Tax=uncultured Propionivibrio sp. TaxID=426737 RepID=UPI0029C0295C|nr:L-glyceraldehyde 3-phosphate reductase [uncultured Propionivibrio sp.]
MTDTYQPLDSRYTTMPYQPVGRSGLKLPRFSLGLWHNFGQNANAADARALLLRAFDLGITHFDLANNYGPPPGAAERFFGEILHADLAAHRDELIISTKAGYPMWPGPYGTDGSRKHLLSSLDQSLKRMRLDYVDIFYSHRFDPDTPLEETMGALATAVLQGKALYVGLSSYSAKKTREAAALLRQMGVRCLIHQPSYSMLNRWIEPELLPALQDEGIGCIVFSPLAQGLLTGKYQQGIPSDSRKASGAASFRDNYITPETLERIQKLAAIAERRGQSLAQMSLAWVLRHPQVSSALIGASRISQLEENIAALSNTRFSPEELAEIDLWATDAGLNIWAASSNAG